MENETKQEREEESDFEEKKRYNYQWGGTKK